MAIASRSRRSDNTWPGFVDALTSLLLVIIFLLSVFMLTHFFLSQALSGREEALERLNQQVAELADLLSLERQANADLRLNVAQLSSSLQDANKAHDELVLKLDESTNQLDDTRARLAAAEQATEVDRQTIKAQLADIERLKRDIGALRKVRQGLEAKVADLAGRLESSQRDLSQLRDKSRELAAELASEQERTALAQKTIGDRDIRLSELQALLNSRDSELEDERDLSLVGTDLDLYRALARGYLDGAGGFLTAEEIELMPFAARLVTFTIGLRFLTDHLAGDVYFKTSRTDHNLDRARVQFGMVAWMEAHERDLSVRAARS